MSWNASGFPWDSSTGWGYLVVFASMIIFFIYTLVYMLARGLKIDQLERAAVAEMMQALLSIVLAVSIVLILSLTFQFLISYLAGGGSSYITCDAYGKITLSGPGPIEAVRCRLTEKAAILSDLYEKMFYAAREPFNKFSVSWGVLGLPIYYQGAFTFQTKPSRLYYEVESYRFLNSVITTLLIGINGYLAAIDYVANTMLTMFLPIGLVLRAIPFTRGIGAFFIAVAIGLYIVYPILFFITDPTFIKVESHYLDITKDQPNWPWPSFKGAVALSTLAPQTSQATTAFTITNIRNIASNLSRFYYFFIIHPVMILSITLIIMRYLAYLFGGEGQELYRLAMKVL